MHGKAITLAPENLRRWHRGEDPQTLVPQRQRQEFLRLTLDCYGIKTLDFLYCWPEASSYHHRGLWYILEKVSRLKDFDLQFKVHVLLNLSSCC